MLRLLLDEQISPEVAVAFRKLSSGSIGPLRDFEGGRLLGQSDEVILEIAADAKLTLVTYDVRTVRPLLRKWGQHNKEHGGVVFVSPKSIASSDFGKLARALAYLVEHSGTQDWVNQSFFLTGDF